MWLDLNRIFDPDAGAIRPESGSPVPGDLPADWHFEWDERAAIMEYEGGLPRERAEHLALTDIVARMSDEPRPSELEAES